VAPAEVGPNSHFAPAQQTDKSKFSLLLKLTSNFSQKELKKHLRKHKNTFFSSNTDTPLAKTAARGFFRFRAAKNALFYIDLFHAENIV
jgi:hypothetical protein